MSVAAGQTSRAKALLAPEPVSEMLPNGPRGCLSVENTPEAVRYTASEETASL